MDLIFQFKSAAMIELEASLKACRVLIVQCVSIDRVGSKP